MHEYSIVQQLVNGIIIYLDEQNIKDVRSVQVRRDSTFSAEALQQSYEMLTKGTILEKAPLIVEDLQVEHTCSSCGHTQKISSEDLVHHVFFCPKCNTGDEIEEAHGLKLLGVAVED